MAGTGTTPFYYGSEDEARCPVECIAVPMPVLPE
jgi:hypothetical protein